MRQLLIRPGAIGDCIAALPIFEYLATAYTEIWVPTAITPLVRFGPAVHSIASTGIDVLGVADRPVPKSLVQRLRSFDRIISWYGANRTEFRATVSDLQLPFVFHAALPPSNNTLHITDFLARQVGAPPGLTARLDVGSARGRGTIAIHPFSGSPKKNWPLACFRQLAALLPLPVEWTAGLEEELPEAVRFEDLFALAQWLAGARLYIGNDSGITHLAAAVGIPVLALFSATTNPAVWAPRGNVAVMPWEPSCGLSPDAVALAALRCLAASGQSASVLP